MTSPCVEHAFAMREAVLDTGGTLQAWVCVRCGCVAADRPAGHRPDGTGPTPYDGRHSGFSRRTDHNPGG